MVASCFFGFEKGSLWLKAGLELTIGSGWPQPHGIPPPLVFPSAEITSLSLSQIRSGDQSCGSGDLGLGPELRHQAFLYGRLSAHDLDTSFIPCWLWRMEAWNLKVLLLGS